MLQKIKNNWVFVLIGMPILTFIGTYCLTTDDIDPTAGMVIGLSMYAIALFGFIFGVLKS